MKAIRQQEILEYLSKNQRATTNELIEITGASPATIRRDLAVLKKKGLLVRSHGGALAGEDRGEIRSQGDGNWRPVQDLRLPEKESIARCAARQVESGDHIFVGAGMTGNLLCRWLRKMDADNVTVVTTSITAVMELAGDARFSIMLLGGNIHAGSNHIETMDETTIHALSQYYFDKGFFTVDGADIEYGYSIKNKAERMLYLCILKNSRDSFLMLGQSKLNKKTFSQMIGLEGVPNVITEQALPIEYDQIYREKGVNIIISE